MMHKQLLELAALSDLNQMKSEIFSFIEHTLRNQQIKEFYTPKELSAISGLKYSTVVNYCATGTLAATQTTAKGGWVIDRNEIDRLHQQARINRIRIE